MKKQYLIGLLSLVAISIPLGNSLLTSANNQMLQTNNNTMVYDGNQELEETTNPFVEAEPDMAPTMTITEKNDALTETQLETQYEVHYEIDPGTNSRGNPNKIEEVRWIDVGNPADDPNENFGETLNTTTGSVEGNYKAKGLTPDTHYDTQIIVTFDDEDLTIVDGSNNYGVDTVAHPLEAPKVESSTKVTNITETSATLKYEIDPGINSHNEKNEIERVEWVNSDGSLFGGTETNTDGETTGTFDATGLNPNVEYSTTVKVYFVDSKVDPNNECFLEVPFTTTPHTPEPTSIDPVLENTTEDTATVSYTIDPGKDESDKPYKIKSVEWVNEDNSAFGGTEANTDGKTKGSFTATGLTPGDTYNTKINVTFADDSQNITENNDVEVTTKEADIESPTIKTINAETTLNSVTFDYEATEGQDYQAQPYFLASIEVFDNENTSMYVEGDENAVVADKLDLTGTINIDGLESGTTYEGWTISATFIDTNKNYDNSEVEVNDIDPFTTQQDKTGLGWCAIFWITILVLIIVGIIVWLLTYFYLVFKNRNNFNGEIEEVIIVE